VEALRKKERGLKTRTQFITKNGAFIGFANPPPRESMLMYFAGF
jgi:hypothetical protein